MPSLLSENSHMKIFVLYLMYNIGHPATYSDLEEAAGYGDYVAGLDFPFIFSELKRDGAVEAVQEGEKELFRISEKGIMVVENLQHLLPFSVRDRGLKMALRLLQFKKTGAEMSHSVKPEGTGYRFEMKISESGTEKLNISLHVRQKESAQAMDYAAENRPEALYRGIMAVLTGDVGFL